MTNTDAPDYAKAHHGRVPGRGGREGGQHHRQCAPQVRAGRHLAEPLADRRSRSTSPSGRASRRPDRRNASRGDAAARVVLRASRASRPPHLACRCRCVCHRAPCCCRSASWWSSASGSGPASQDPARLRASRPMSPSSTGARLAVLERSFLVSIEATTLSLLIAYPIAYFLARQRKAVGSPAGPAAVHRSVPGQLHHPHLRLDLSPRAHRPDQRQPDRASASSTARVDWLLYSDFAVLVGLISSYMPFMIFPLWLSLAGIDRQSPRGELDARRAALARLSCSVTLPLSLPGIFAASSSASSAASARAPCRSSLGGVGYQLIGNDHHQHAGRAELSARRRHVEVVTAAMLALLAVWYLRLRHALLPRQDPLPGGCDAAWRSSAGALVG